MTNKNFLKIFLGLMMISSPMYSQVTIGDNKYPENFSVLELLSHDKQGLRLPQMTTEQRTALSDKYGSNPKMMGLTIFNINTNCVEIWSGYTWISWCAPINQVCHTSSTKGTDFWISFGKNFNQPTSANVILALKISAEEATDVKLTFTYDNSTTTYSIADNSLTTINLVSVQGLGNKKSAVYIGDIIPGVYNYTLHITSQKPISVYAFNTVSATSDATVLLPVDSWGKDYYRLSYAPIDGFNDFEIIIAKEDNTKIFLNSSSTPFATLNAGQVYSYPQVYDLQATPPTNGDMTGRHITSDKPIAYFTHNSLAQVPTGRTAGDILFEQMMPVNRWGKKFLVTNAPEGANTMNNHIRIIASENQTTVNFTGATVVTMDASNKTIPGETIIYSGGKLDAGQWVELIINGTNTDACYIETDKPVAVAAYMVGATTSGPPLGDPSIAWIPSLNQSILTSIISPFLFPAGSSGTNLGSSDAIHYMIIITPTNEKEQTTINGSLISSTEWIDNADSGYSYYYWYFDNVADLNKIFKVANPVGGVIVLCGGIGSVESYYYNAGSGTCIIN